MLIDMPSRALVLDFSSVIYIDSSGEKSLEELLETYHDKGVPILVYGLRQQPWCSGLIQQDTFLREY